VGEWVPEERLHPTEGEITGGGDGDVNERTDGRVETPNQERKKQAIYVQRGSDKGGPGNSPE